MFWSEIKSSPGRSKKSLYFLIPKTWWKCWWVQMEDHSKNNLEIKSFWKLHCTRKYNSTQIHSICRSGSFHMQISLTCCFSVIKANEKKFTIPFKLKRQEAKGFMKNFWKRNLFQKLLFGSLILHKKKQKATFHLKF